jgi:hypothetical protein
MHIIGDDTAIIHPLQKTKAVRRLLIPEFGCLNSPNFPTALADALYVLIVSTPDNATMRESCSGLPTGKIAPRTLERTLFSRESIERI